MIPNPIPQEPGCLSVLLHEGSWPQAGEGAGWLKTKSGFMIPILGTAGTRDPDLTLMLEWFAEHAEDWSPVAPVETP